MIALAIGAAFVLALAYFPVLALGRTPRVATLSGLAVAMLLLPLLVAPEHRFVRFLVGVNALWLMMKLYDLHLAADRRARPELRAFLAFLLNPFSLVLRKRHDEPLPSVRVNLSRLSLGIFLTALGLSAWSRLAAADLGRYPFVLEHCIKVLVLLIIVEGGAEAAVAAWRLLGGQARDVMGPYYTAPTPAAFWRRYNRIVGQFAWEDIFKPAGGRQAPPRAALAAFVFSAVVHEYLFWVALGRVQGLQLAFFTIQGCAVAATLRVKPKGWRAGACAAATLVFNFASSMLFFASWNGLMPFYARALPPWLGGH